MGCTLCRRLVCLWNTLFVFWISTVPDKWAVLSLSFCLLIIFLLTEFPYPRTTKPPKAAFALSATTNGHFNPNCLRPGTTSHAATPQPFGFSSAGSFGLPPTCGTAWTLHWSSVWVKKICACMWAILSGISGNVFHTKCLFCGAMPNWASTWLSSSSTVSQLPQRVAGISLLWLWHFAEDLTGADAAGVFKIISTWETGLRFTGAEPLLCPGGTHY